MVIDSLCDQARDGDLAVAWLYCDHGAQREQTVINMMGAILKRLVGSEVPKDIQKAFQEKRRPLLTNLLSMLKTAIDSLPQVFICIDALDEFLPEDLPELLVSLRDIVLKSPKTRIFLTGRPYIREDIQEYFGGAVVIPIVPKTEGVRGYLKMRLDKDNKRREMKEEFRTEIVRTILENMSDMCVELFVVVPSISNVYLRATVSRFLLASLIIDAVLREKTIGQRKKKLAEMARGKGLSDAYTATLKQLKPKEGDEPELGLKALMWMSCSERPLRVEELCHALGVEIGSADLDLENAPSSQTLLESCLGLATVDKSSSTVRLVHFTLQEHLLSDPILFHSPHSIIAEVCLTYLNFGPVRELSPTLLSAPSTMPFLEYASCFWGEHTRSGVTENTKALALKLLDRFDENISAQLLLLRYERRNFSGPSFDGAEGPVGFTGLHGAAFLGIVEIFAAISVTKEWNFNAVDCMGCTALIWAVQRGQEAVVKVLLEKKDVNPDQADTNYGQTPLAWAAVLGHEGIVKMLVERKDVDPNQADTEYGRTPLAWAAKKGHEKVVKMLLEREDVNADQPDTKYGRTPLAWAAKHGHEGVVKMLLERKDVNPDQPDTNYSQTPLLFAAKKGHGRVVKMLLERKNVDPNHVDTIFGRTALALGAEGGHVEVVKVLLERKDVDPNLEDSQYGRTPLSLGAEGGHAEIVKMLLKREDVDPSHVDTIFGQTPLAIRAEGGHVEVVKMLLEREDVDPDQAETKFGRTPLGLGAAGGHVEVVRMLLEREDVNPDHADTEYGRTPLWWAALGGYKRIVKMLLERKDVNPNLKNTENFSMPLSWKVGNGCVEIVGADRGDNEGSDVGGSEGSDWEDSDGSCSVKPGDYERDSDSEDNVDSDVGDSEGSDVGDNDSSFSLNPGDFYWEDGDGPNPEDNESSDPEDDEGSSPGDDEDSDCEDGEPVVAPLSLVPPKEDGAARILVDPDNANSDKFNHGGQSSLPPSPGNKDKSVVEIRSGSPDINADITHFKSQPSHTPTDPDGREPASDPKDSIPTSPNNNPPATESPMSLQPSPTLSLKVSYPLRKTNTHPQNIRSTLPVVVNRYWVIAVFICLLAFLAYILPSWLPDTFPFHQ